MTPDMIKANHDIAARIRRQRINRKWTQEQLAEKIGMTRNTLNMKERGERAFSIPEAIRIADAFRISLEELIRGVRPDQLDIHRNIGLNRDAIRNLLHFHNTATPEQMTALNAFLSSADAVSIITDCLSLPDGEDKYTPPKNVIFRDGMVECEMTPGSLRIILEHTLCRTLRQIRKEITIQAQIGLPRIRRYQKKEASEK